MPTLQDLFQWLKRCAYLAAAPLFLFTALTYLLCYFFPRSRGFVLREAAMFLAALMFSVIVGTEVARGRRDLKIYAISFAVGLATLAVYSFAFGMARLGQADTDKLFDTWTLKQMKLFLLGSFLLCPPFWFLVEFMLIERSFRGTTRTGDLLRIKPKFTTAKHNVNLSHHSVNHLRSEYYLRLDWQSTKTQPERGDFDVFKYYQQLGSKIWIAVSAALGLLFFGDRVWR